MTKINIKPAAQTYLADKIPANSIVLLTTDDGSNKYSSVGATCALADKFQLIILHEPDSNFTVSAENNAGYQMYLKETELYLLGKGLKVDFNHGRLLFGDDTGILDSNLSVVDWRNVQPETEKERRMKMEKLGQQIC